jgi:hypothetical protein
MQTSNFLQNHYQFSSKCIARFHKKAMKEVSKEDINQEVFDLYDDYAHNRIDRRKFLDSISAHAIGGITVASLLSFVMPNYQENLQVLPEDPSPIQNSSITTPLMVAGALKHNFPGLPTPRVDFQGLW